MIVKTFLCGAVIATFSCGSLPGAQCGPGTELRGGVCVVATTTTTTTTSDLDSLLSGANIAFSDDERLGNYVGGLFFKRRVVWTHLAYQSALASAQRGTALIGEGIALHITGAQADESLSGDTLANLTIESSGPCPNTTSPEAFPKTQFDNPKDGAAYGAVYAWKNGQWTMQHCITSGLIRVQGVYASYPTVTLTAQFDDGTVWSDKTFSTGPQSQ
jgi:hypothetical protein